MEALLRPDAVLHRLATGATWAEGPVWLPHDGSVLWSDVVGNRVLRWDPAGRASVFLADAEFENGHTLDHDGSIVACSHGHRRIERLALDGTLTPIVDRYRGMRFNSPNDVVVKSDGTIWFTDPPYGITSNREGHEADRRSATASCSGSTRARASSTPSPTGSRSRTASPSRPTRPCSTSRTRLTPPTTTAAATTTSRRSTWSTAGASRTRGCSTRRRLGAGRLPGGRRGQRLDVRRRRHPRGRARTAGASAGCRCPSGRRTASSAAPASIACSSPPRRRSTRSTWPPEASCPAGPR